VGAWRAETRQQGRFALREIPCAADLPSRFGGSTRLVCKAHISLLWRIGRQWKLIEIESAAAGDEVGSAHHKKFIALIVGEIVPIDPFRGVRQVDAAISGGLFDDPMINQPFMCGPDINREVAESFIIVTNGKSKCYIELAAAYATCCRGDCHGGHVGHMGALLSYIDLAQNIER
jgi:hypothetical protein